MNKIESILKYVSENNEFYRDIIKKNGIKDPLNINEYPILTKQDIQNNRYDMFSYGYKAKYYAGLLHRQFSSGSTGIPVNVYWDYNDLYVSNISLWRKRLQWYNIHPYDNYVMFTLNGYKTISDSNEIYYAVSKNILMINITLVQTDEQYEKIVKMINEFNPTWFYIQPYVLNKLIQTYVRCGMPTPSAIRYIEVIGEYLPSDLRRQAAALFRSHIVNMYGSEEMNCIAYELAEKRFVVLEDNVYIEVQNKSGICRKGIGEAIITNLNNRAMPLIRYKQGDTIFLDSVESEIGSLLIIKNIVGRTSKSININNIEINSYLLSETISETNNILNDPIVEYLFLFNTKISKLECYIKVNNRFKKWKLEITKKINEIFKSKISNKVQIDIDVTLKDNINYPDEKHSIFEIV